MSGSDGAERPRWGVLLGIALAMVAAGSIGSALGAVLEAWQATRALSLFGAEGYVVAAGTQMAARGGTLGGAVLFAMIVGDALLRVTRDPAKHGVKGAIFACCAGLYIPLWVMGSVMSGVVSARLLGAPLDMALQWVDAWDVAVGLASGAASLPLLFALPWLSQWADRSPRALRWFGLVGMTVIYSAVVRVLAHLVG